MIGAALSQEQREQEELELLAGLLESHFGLRFTLSSRDLIDSGLRALLQKQSLPRSALMRRLMAGDAALLHGLATSTVVSETYLFRHPEHFTALVQHVVPAALRDGRRELRAWSAGCATGEEAYSLAATLQAAAPQVELTVLGTDVNEVSLAEAAAGRYGARSLRGELPAWALGWPRQPTAIDVPASVRAVVRFHPLNLHAAHYPDELVPPASFDVIFCRNVLVYFAAEAAHAVLLRLRDRLREGGYLFMAALDYTAPIPGLVASEVGGVAVLRRVSRAAPGTTVRRAPLDRMQEAKTAADSGEHSQAFRLIRDALATKRTPEWLHLLALVTKESGQRNETLALLGEAVALGADYVQGHLSLGLILLEPLRDAAAARCHLTQVLTLLSGRSEQEQLPGPEPIAVGLARALASAGLRQLQEDP